MAARVNTLWKLWQALALVDPRPGVQERALLEAIYLQHTHLSLIHGDIAYPYCSYALLYGSGSLLM